MLNLKELVSESVDNENLSSDLLEKIVSDKNVSDTWINYCLMSQVLQAKDGDIYLDRIFTDKISAKIENMHFEEQPIMQSKFLSVLPNLKNKCYKAFVPFIQVGVAAGVFFSVVGGFSLNSYLTNTTSDANITKAATSVPIYNDIELVGLKSKSNIDTEKELKLTDEQKNKINAVSYDYQLQRRTFSTSKE